VEPDDHVEGYVGERGEEVGEREHFARFIRHVAGWPTAYASKGAREFRPRIVLSEAGWQNASQSEQNARAPHALELRKRAIDSREHFLFPKNLEEMI
jgi:hypothetical protein